MLKNFKIRETSFSTEILDFAKLLYAVDGGRVLYIKCYVVIDIKLFYRYNHMKMFVKHNFAQEMTEKAINCGLKIEI